MGDTTLTLTDLEDEEAVAVLGGICAFQMQALSTGATQKVIASGTALQKLAEENPEEVREVFLENRGAFHVASMPQEVLDHLGLKLEDGTLYENTDGDEWTEVEIGD